MRMLHFLWQIELSHTVFALKQRNHAFSQKLLYHQTNTPGKGFDRFGRKSEINNKASVHMSADLTGVFMQRFSSSLEVLEA